MFSRLTVSFKDDMFIAYNRVESYTWIDTLSYIGGFCGLLMGASVLSVIELLYYLTLRAFFAYRNNQNDDNPRQIAQVFPYLP